MLERFSNQLSGVSNPHATSESFKAWEEENVARIIDVAAYVDNPINLVAESDSFPLDILDQRISAEGEDIDTTARTNTETKAHLTFAKETCVKKL